MRNRLYVGNLSYDSTEDSLRQAFSSCGEVAEVHVVTDRVTGQPRGFAFVTMANEQDAQKAIDTLSGSQLDGRALRVNVAEERQPRGGGGGGGGRGGGRDGGGRGDRRFR